MLNCDEDILSDHENDKITMLKDYNLSLKVVLRKYQQDLEDIRTYASIERESYENLIQELKDQLVSQSQQSETVAVTSKAVPSPSYNFDDLTKIMAIPSTRNIDCKLRHLQVTNVTKSVLIMDGQ